MSSLADKIHEAVARGFDVLFLPGGVRQGTMAVRFSRGIHHYQVQRSDLEFKQSRDPDGLVERMFDEAVRGWHDHHGNADGQRVA